MLWFGDILSYIFIWFTVGTAYRGGTYQQGSGPVYLSNTICRGTEDSLLECPFLNPISFFCSHANDAGVKCYESGTDLCNIYSVPVCTCTCVCVCVCKCVCVFISCTCTNNQLSSQYQSLLAIIFSFSIS